LALFVTLAVIAAIPHVFAQASRDPALVAHYKFDEGHAGRAVRDYSGHRNHGKNMGARYVKGPEGTGYALRFGDDKGYVERTGDVPNRILFGIHPCDVHGIQIMDELFLEEYKDPYYAERREKTLLLGHSCIPDDKCMCFATDTEFVAEGFDLFFTDLKMFYLVWVGSSRGHDIVRMRPELFSRDIGKDDIMNYTEYRNWKSAQFTSKADFTGMPDIFELGYNSPVWEELAEKCLSCGQCTMACPTCNCYNVVDEVDLGTVEGTRDRFWDSCMFREYSLIAGGHNFRDSRADRLKLWYTHKLQAYIGEFGKPACVGCGRCVATCPVDINVVSVSKALKEQEVGK